MLYFPQSRIELTVERPLAPGAVINAEGSALAGVITAGSYGVKNTTGTNDIFAGIAINNPINPVTLPYFETDVVPANGILPLAFLPNTGTLLVINNVTGLALTLVATGLQSSLTVTQFQIDGTNPAALDFDPALSGTSVTVSYRYNPTVMQSMFMQGMQLPGGPAGAYLGQIGVITRGDAYTSEFDTSANWATAVGVTLEANGLFGAAATAATAVPGIQLLALPSSSSAYLGLFINAPH